ncbi:MAG: hypothetical protein QG652_1318, partial [Pseudomonadota bacterium]|nr:hypothetical protein [Pseudomonadota bacterium]
KSVTLPLTPSRQGRGNLMCPTPLLDLRVTITRKKPIHLAPTYQGQGK